MTRLRPSIGSLTPQLSREELRPSRTAERIRREREQAQQRPFAALRRR